MSRMFNSNTNSNTSNTNSFKNTSSRRNRTIHHNFTKKGKSDNKSIEPSVRCVKIVTQEKRIPIRVINISDSEIKKRPVLATWESRHKGFLTMTRERRLERTYKEESIVYGDEINCV